MCANAAGGGGHGIDSGHSGMVSNTRPGGAPSLWHLPTQPAGKHKNRLFIALRLGRKKVSGFGVKT